MLRTMITATNSLSQTQQQIDNIAGNISNIGTHGYKAKRVNFSELMYQQFQNEKFDRVQRQSPIGIRYGVGAKIGQSQATQTQGALQKTDRNLDFSLTKESHHFNVSLPNGETAFTRNGAFYVSPTEPGIVLLVNGDGYPVLDSNGQRITFPDDAQNFSMSESGTLNVIYENRTENFDLAITKVLKPQALEHDGAGTYIQFPANLDELNYTEEELATDLLGETRDQVSIQSGVLEMSNVDFAKEMADLMATQKTYHFHTRAISIADQMLGLINGVRS